MADCLEIGGVSCDEDMAQYTENPSNDLNSSGVRVFRCAWEDRITLANYLLTANTVSGYSQVGVAHPRYPFWYASNVSMKPDTQLAATAQVQTTYKPLDFNPNSPATIREARMGICSDVIPMMAQSVLFSDGTPADQAEQFTLNYLTYKVTLKNVTSFPLSAVISCSNCVHNGTMSLSFGGNFTFVPGDQVLYNGIDDIAIGYTSAGAQRFDVTHNFLISPIGLNKVYNPSSMAGTAFGRFETVTPTKYASANLASLGV